MSDTADRPKILNVPGYTRHFRPQDSERKWHLIDAKGQSVGRLATQVATLLRGKHKPTFTRHDDAGDFVVVINAEGLQFRGNNKANKKKYYKHTGYFGHLRDRTATEMLTKNPELVLKKAVYGMVPKGPLGYRMMKKLKIYRGAEHPHKAQNPAPYEVRT